MMNLMNTQNGKLFEKKIFFFFALALGRLKGQVLSLLRSAPQHNLPRNILVYASSSLVVTTLTDCHTTFFLMV